MLQVYKYPIYDNAVIEMPMGAKIIHVDIQLSHESQISLWAIVDPKKETEKRNFVIYGTGWDLSEDKMNHIGTVMDGIFVWHIFEVLK